MGQAKCHVVLGKRGDGKSRLCRTLCFEDRRLVVIDTLGEHVEDGYVKPAETPEAFRRVLLEADPAKPFRVGFYPGSEDEFEWAVQAVAARRGLALFIDEIDFWYEDSRTTPGQPLRNMVRYGRHDDQRLVVVARRPAAVHRSITSQAVLWVFPGITEPRDVDYIERYAPELDMATLAVRQTQGDYKIETDVARVEDGKVTIWRFNLVTGVLAPTNGVTEAPKGGNTEDALPRSEDIPKESPETPQDAPGPPTEVPE